MTLEYSTESHRENGESLQGGAPQGGHDLTLASREVSAKPGQEGLATGHGEALRFLELLGKDPQTTYFRTIRPRRGGANKSRRGADLLGFDPAALTADNEAGDSIYAVLNHAIGASGKKRDGTPTHCVIDRDIADCNVLFVEWDDMPKVEQLTAWRDLGLPEPTAMVDSGGKSIHAHWRLVEPITPTQWREATARLIAHCESDRSCSNPSRVMRLPGFKYLCKETGQPTGTRAELLHVTGKRYSLAEVLACLPDPQRQHHTTPTPRTTPPRPAGAKHHEPRPLEQVRKALACIPRRVAGNGNYRVDRNILWGLIRACEEAGSDQAMAIALMEEHSPSAECGWEVEQVGGYDFSQVNANTFWHHARAHGWTDRPQSRTNAAPRPADQPGGADMGHGPAAGPGGEVQEPPQQPQPQPPTLAEIREQLENAVADGVSSTDLEVQILALADAGGQSPASLKGLLRAIEEEHEARLGIAAETHNLLTEADRQELGQGITLDYLFGDRLAEALGVVCRTLPSDAPSAGLAYLTGIAGLTKLGCEVIMSKAADFRVPLNLYSAGVGVSGAKKSPLGKRLIKKPASPLELELAQAHKRAMADWTEQNRGIKQSERPDPPGAVYLHRSDFTIEALAEQLQRQEAKGLSLLIYRDELSALFGSLGAYKGGRGADEQYLLETFDGNEFSSLRVSTPGGGRFYERCNLSIYGTIQPGILQKLVANGDDSGLWARFIFAPLPAVVVPLPEEETVQAQQEAATAEAVLAKIARAVYVMPRVSLGLDPAARRAFVRYEEACQHEVHRVAIGAQSALWGKSAGKVLRVAGLLHLLQLEATGGDAGELISPDTMERATAFVDHLNGWTLSLHAGVTRQGPGDIMRIVHRIATEARQPIRWADIAKKLSTKQRKEIDSNAVRLAMEALTNLKVGETEAGCRGALTYRATGPLS